MGKVTHNRDMRTLDTKTSKMKGTWVVRIELENKLLPKELLRVLFWLRGGTCLSLWQEVNSTA